MWTREKQFRSSLSRKVWNVVRELPCSSPVTATPEGLARGAITEACAASLPLVETRGIVVCEPCDIDECLSSAKAARLYKELQEWIDTSREAHAVCKALGWDHGTLRELFGYRFFYGLVRYLHWYASRSSGGNAYTNETGECLVSYYLVSRFPGYPGYGGEGVWLKAHWPRWKTGVCVVLVAALVALALFVERLPARVYTKGSVVVTARS